MLASQNRLGPKLLLTTLSFLLVLVVATAFLVLRGFRRTQNDATQQSIEGLEKQGQEALAMLAQREAQISAAQFQQAAVASEHAAEYMLSLIELGGGAPGKTVEQLTRAFNGNYTDADASRISDIYIPSFVTADEALRRDLQDTAALDAIFPTLLERYPDAVAIYYIGTQGYSRYYPPIGLAEVIPPDFNVLEAPFYAEAAPEANPERKTVWIDPYLDPAGQGAMVTASTPLYVGETFRGIIGIDVQLNRLIDRLNSLRPTQNGYAFLVDQNGNLVTAPPVAIKDVMGEGAITSFTLTETLGLALTKSPNEDFQGILRQMQGDESGVGRIELNGKEVFLAYAPLQGMGWSLGLVAPIYEVTEQANEVAEAISSGTDRTVHSTLVTLVAFFLIAIVGVAFLSRRLTRPLAALVEGTQAVASGNLGVSIPVTSRDELGQLARSFNEMTAQLHSARQRLETWNATLERTVQERTAELAQMKDEAEQARAAAEQANQLKTQFLANMSHELRTPLNSIINFTRILLTGARGPVNEGQVDYLERVRHSGEHLLGLINDILDLSKIEAGRMELLKEPVQIADLIESVMATAAGLTKGKRTELHLEIEAQLPIIQADRTRVRQVLLNLLSNAAKFTERGSITVRARQEDGFLVVSVTDTGIGIAPEHLPLIFEEFRQVNGSVNRRYEGTGLGLTICRRLVDMHNGRIWVESQVGVGSSFSFSLPVEQVEEQNDQVTAARLESPEADSNNSVVLVIDNDQASIDIVSDYLSRDGYTIYGLTDSRRALDEARRLKPAAIILDVLMPRKDGWEVLAELRADPGLGAVPVALYTILDEKKLGFYLGASAYLTKPIDEDQLRATIGRLVSHGSRVLVIDDDENARQVIMHQIEQAGAYQVSAAAGGREGLAMIAQSPPNLIILDLMMPDIDGFAVLDQLEREHALSDIPVIVLTAKDLTREEHDHLNRRVNGLLTKAATPAEELLARMAALLQPLRDQTTGPDAEKRG